jgi:transcriptional regulator of acetoin/glycerol metabolism
MSYEAAVSSAASMSPPRKPATPRPKKPKGGPRTYGRLQRVLDEAARKEILAVLQETNGNVTEAAVALGISRRGLWKRIAALGIDAEAHRP